MTFLYYTHMLTVVRKHIIYVFIEQPLSTGPYNIGYNFYIGFILSLDLSGKEVIYN